jgi:uncharacterized protein YbbK (DUF523 family)/uncharacterized protein YbgA (DUF1722 family)
MSYPKPVVVVSRCLEFEPVRYNGQVIPCTIVKELEPFVKYIKVCPEYEVGLGVPRDPIRIVQQKEGLRLIQPKTKEDITDKMNKFTLDFIEKLPEVDGFIFKADSPTIGLRNIKIYSGIEKAPVVKRGHGFFAGQLLERYPDYPMEEDNRLRNNTIRHHFLTKLFIFAGFREIRKSKNIEGLEKFHNENHFLFGLYNPELIHKGKKNLENKDKDFIRIVEEYFILIKKYFKSHPNSTNYIRVWKEMIKYFGSKISTSEKKYFNNILIKFQKNMICETGVNEIIRSFALRFSDDFIENQTIFNPYPEELLPILDPKRDKDYWN